jgi:hypothetical protein
MPRLYTPRLVLLALIVATGCGKKDGGGSSDGAPAVSDKAAREEARKRLQAIRKAMYQFEEAFHHFPAGVVSKGGTVGLSWRVQLLPHLGEEELWKEFKQDEPWDSDHNQKLVPRMPNVFASPGKPAPEGQTYLRSFVGETAFIPAPPPQPKGAKPQPPYPLAPPGGYVRGRRVVDITDGTSNTFAVAEAAEPVVWTRPDDLPLPGWPGANPPPPVPKLGGPFPDGFHGLMCDGQVYFFPAGVDEKLLRALITATGGEVLGEEWEKLQFPAGRPPEPPDAVPDTLPEAAARRTAVDNLRKLTEGVLGYEQRSDHIPAGVVTADGAVGLSWRVQVLPFIGEGALYKQFKLDESWDSPANKSLVETMPAVFGSQGKPAPGGHTFLRTTQGPAGMVPPPRGKPGTPGQPYPGQSRRFNFKLVSAFLVVEAAEAVPWTKPDELQCDPKQPVPKLGGVFAGGFHAATLDGTVTFVKDDYPEGELREMLDPFGFYSISSIASRSHILYRVRPSAEGRKGVKVYGK